MNVHASFDAAAYCRDAQARRNRLMGVRTAVKTVEAVVEPAPVIAPPRPNWAVPEPLPFEAHVSAYRASSACAKTPKDYVGRRAKELGFSREDIVGEFTFAPFFTARVRIAHDLRRKYRLSLPQIGRLLKRHHTCVLNLLSKPMPTEEQASLSLTLPSGVAYLRAFEDSYFAGVSYEDLTARYRLTHTAIRKLVIHMGWPARKPHLTKPKTKRWAKYQTGSAAV